MYLLILTSCLLVLSIALICLGYRLRVYSNATWLDSYPRWAIIIVLIICLAAIGCSIVLLALYFSALNYCNEFDALVTLHNSNEFTGSSELEYDLWTANRWLYDVKFKLAKFDRWSIYDLFRNRINNYSAFELNS